MQFQVPQFIEVENKIVGPLTLRQFLYLATAGMICFMFYFILQTWLWVIITAFLGGVAMCLAFIKYNGQPLPKIVWSAFNFFWKPRFYLWKRMPKKQVEPAAEIEAKRKSMQGIFPVKKLWHDLMTTTTALTKREKGGKPEEKVQVFRKATGERSVAKRVDYR